MKIAIEANIGCGKTTLLNTINKNHPKLPIFLEPVDTDWKEGLDMFYKDNERWGFAFNLTVLKTYHGFYTKDNNTPLSLYERSPLSCYHVFSKLQFEAGRMTDYEHNLFDYIYKSMSWTPDVVIYIQTPPEVCFERMNNRGRECESGVPLEYLQSVHNKYEQLVNHLSTTAQDTTTVHIVNGNQPMESVYNDVMKIVTSYTV
jgi:deoxyadenosine/deoxycytidine kinase